jgi:N-acyl-D-amino-acid deacylase
MNESLSRAPRIRAPLVRAISILAPRILAPLVLAPLTLASAACTASDDPGAGSRAGAGADAFAPFFGAPPVAEPPYDWALGDALLVDGSGAPARSGGALVKDGKIVYVGPLDPDTVEARERWMLDGRVLAPGFIDAHAHGDPLETPGFPNFLAQGVTTVFLGMDGSSPRAGALEGIMDRTDALGPLVNVGWLAGHGSLRMESGMGYDPSTPEGREILASLVGAAMDRGAFGVSLGLEYDAGLPADAEELARIGVEVAARGGIISSHMRNEDADQVEASLAELIEQGRASGARVHASHLKVVLGRDPGQATRILAQMDRARAEGVLVSADVYPYTASFTGISILFPDWARPPHDYAQVSVARRDELLDHLRGRVLARNGPEATLFGSGPWSGKTLEAAAAETGRPFEELLLDLGPSGARAAYFVMDDAVMTRFLLDPHTVISSDGSPVMSHPRGYGSFARILRRFVVEERALSLEDAVARMSGRTAALFGLSDPARVELPRGLLRPGFAADLVVFHPHEVRDAADFVNPFQLAEGVAAVWVNGVRVWAPGAGTPTPDAATAGGPGRALRARWTENR